MIALGLCIALFTGTVTTVIVDMTYRAVASRPARICAWCRKVMQAGRLPASHGICPKCLARWS